MRKTFSIIVILVLLLVALAAAGVWKYQQVLTSLNLHQFDFQLDELGWRHARFERVSFVYPTDVSEERIKLTDVEFNWLWRSWFAPELVSVKLSRAQIDHTLVASPQKNSQQEPFVLPEQWQIPDFLPQQINIEQLLVSLPCPTGNCVFAGTAEAKRVDDLLVLVAQVSPDKTLDSQKHVAIIARYKVQQNLPWLELEISAEDKLKVELETYLVDEGERYWAGQISGVAHYPNAWLLDALQEWSIVISNNWTRSLNQPIKINSDWRVALAPLIAGSPVWSDAVNGTLSLDAVVDSPILIKELGEFSGNVKINIKAADGKLELFHLKGAMDVGQVVMPETLQAQGFNVSDISITAVSAVDAELDASRVPFIISVKTLGAVQADLATNLILDVNNKNIFFEKMQLKTTAKKIAPSDTIQLTNMDVNLTAEGHWQDNEIAIRVSAPSEIKTDLNAPALTLTAKMLEFKTAKFNLAGKFIDGTFDWPTWGIDTQAELSAAQLEHPQLKKNPWHWSGDVKGVLDDVKVNGALTVNRSLNIKHDLHYRAPQLIAEWQLGDVFLLAGNPFADVLNAWPPLLSFLQGRINASGDLKFNIEKNSFKSNAVINLKDVSGIYDTTAFQGLTSSVKLVAQEKSLQLKTDELLVNQINKGITMGPLLAAGSYTINTSAASQGFMQGTLVLDSFKGKVMGGAISVPGQTFDLSQEQQDFTLTLTDIDLALLLKQHPTNELSGSGKISGGIPIRITPQGIMVNKGVVSALPPGGELKFQSTKADAIAKKQPSVKVITDALDDFHYSVLASEVNYDESGKLLLSVKLEGRNPQLENGRPIHFSINLEENIPAMIASLQLSNQISDIIKKRVQEKLVNKKLQDKK